jgi:hypothetical protein
VSVKVGQLSHLSVVNILLGVPDINLPTTRLAALSASSQLDLGIAHTPGQCCRHEPARHSDEKWPASNGKRCPAQATQWDARK